MEKYAYVHLTEHHDWNLTGHVGAELVAHDRGHVGAVFGVST